MPPRERRPAALDAAAEGVNGRKIYAWAAMCVDAGKPPAIEASHP
ncbi:MAG: hypothetical protein RXR47_00335 [Nitrososphaeria archaeon]